MKKIVFLTVSVLVLTVSMVIVSTSCSQEDEIPVVNVDPELNAFFSTKEYLDFQRDNSFITENMLLDKVYVATFPRDMKQYVIPVMVNGHLKGKLNVFSKNGGKVYHSLYEDWSGMSEETGGLVKISAADGQYISTLKYTKIGGSKFEVVIQDVASPVGGTKPKTRVEFPDPDTTGYADCVAQCYAVAKESCDSDTGCKFICDLLDAIGKSCATLSIMAACAIYCA
ncbi:MULTISPECIES: hypothetical protein [Bacteroidaceae]|uniref:Lipoprotein n=1 Tax=Caecibacteroides pullorum TaxID=2725562 RepID=A0AA41DE39_9BACT|nr:MULTISPECIES: hypothetical protein [Bacteroidaceae]MBM6858870.1 hypothetical protein [Caecibacteroides pullorum]MBV8059880.1 hypothetical protein [Caecibacteroides pullorum]